MEFIQGFPNYNHYGLASPRLGTFNGRPASPTLASQPDVQVLLNEVIQALQQLTRAWSTMGAHNGPTSGHNVVGAPSNSKAVSTPPSPRSLTEAQPSPELGFYGKSSFDRRGTSPSNGNSDPAYLAGLTGNDRPLTIYGDSTNAGHDQALNGSGPTTLEGVRQGIEATGNSNALNQDRVKSDTLGSFADQTVPNGLLNLNQSQISQLSNLSPTQLAAMHLWGIQMTSAGKQDGGILENVLQNPQGFTSGEVRLAQQLANEDMQKYGGITGKSLDQAFFGVYQNITGENIASQFENAPIHYSQGPVNLNNRLTGNNGLNAFENTVMVLWGHTPLFGHGINGALESDILAGKDTLFGQAGVNLEGVQALAKADVLESGQITGNSLNRAMISTLNNIYFGAPQATAQQTVTEALQAAAQNGRPLPAGPELEAQVARAVQETPQNLMTQIPQGVNINSGNLRNCPFLNGQRG